jgi:hypothetical protein
MFKLLKWVQLLNSLEDLDEILCTGDDIEDGLDVTVFNLVSSTIPEWWMLELLRWAQLLNRMVVLDEIV